MDGFSYQEHGDGSVTIFDVPIFPVCRRGKDVFDRKWLDRAFSRMQQADQEGHLSPVHVRHHKPGKETPVDAGMVKPRRIGTLRWRGADRPCIYADLVITSQDVFQRIQAKQLRYRSVELDYENAEVISLALLDSEAPFVEMPMTFLRDHGNVASATNTVAAFHRVRESSDPVVAFCRLTCGHTVRTHALLESDMTTTTEDPKLFQDEEPASDTSEGGGEGGESEPKKMGLGDIDLGSIEATAEEWGSFLSDVQNIVNALQGAGASESSESPPEPSEGPAEEPMNMQKMQRVIAELRADVSRQREEMAAERKKLDADQAVREAVAQFQKAGVSIGSDPDAECRKVLESDGITGLRMFTKYRIEGGQKAPKNGYVDEEASKALPDEVVQMMNGSAARGEVVTKMHRDYEASVQAGRLRDSYGKVIPFRAFAEINAAQYGLKD